MTYQEFNREKVDELFKDTVMSAVLDSVMKTRQSTDFHNFFDFSYNTSICFSSDYGGENDASRYYTYTFTFHSYSSLEMWINTINELRVLKGYAGAAEYKKTKPKNRGGKLRDWFGQSKESFKGIIVSFAVEKTIDSLFAPTIEALFNSVQNQEHLPKCPLSPKVLEKAMRVINFSSLILSQILMEGYKPFWMTDRDSIVQGEERRDYVKNLFGIVLQNYCQHLGKIDTGFATPFNEGNQPNYFSADFLSISDLVSGAIDDYANYWDQGTAEEIFEKMKPKSIEILSHFSELPAFIYVVNGEGCRRINIKINE